MPRRPAWWTQIYRTLTPSHQLYIIVVVGICYVYGAEEPPLVRRFDHNHRCVDWAVGETADAAPHGRPVEVAPGRPLCRTLAGALGLVEHGRCNGEPPPGFELAGVAPDCEASWHAQAFNALPLPEMKWMQLRLDGDSGDLGVCRLPDLLGQTGTVSSPCRINLIATFEKQPLNTHDI